jgi:DNA-binding transcriptional LysR family regulator
MIQADLLSLKAFCAIAREGTVSKAADKLFLTQPAVSLQLKSLQERLKLKLFERSGRRLVLTRHGAALLPQAEKVLIALGEFAQSAHSLQGSLRGRLRIGTILDPEFTRLGAFLKALVDAAPHIDTELSQHMSGEVLRRVQAHELDMGFYLATPQELQLLQSPAQPPEAMNPYLFEGNLQNSANMPDAADFIKKFATNIVAIELTRFAYRVLAPAGWSTQILGKDWKALAALPWIETPPASAHHRLLQAALQPLGVQLTRAALVDQEASMLDLVRSGVGLSLARESIALHEQQTRGLAVADKVQLTCCLCLVYSSKADAGAIQVAKQAVAAAWG